MKTSLFPDYILDDTLDNDTPDGCNGINDSNYYENYNHDKILVIAILIIMIMIMIKIMIIMMIRNQCYSRQ